jgi:hypothetical protein
MSSSIPIRKGDPNCVEFGNSSGGIIVIDFTEVALVVETDFEPVPGVDLSIDRCEIEFAGHD